MIFVLARLAKVRPISVLVALLMVSGAALALQQTAIRAKAAKNSAKKSTSFLGQPDRFTGFRVREPSGVTYHARTSHLFVVGDEGSLVELDKNAQVLKKHKVEGNLEDLAVHSPTGNLLLLSEKKSELSLYDPASEQELRRWKMRRAELLGEEPGARNTGFEGLAFRENPTREGGGIFYLLHQSMPEMLVGVAIDLTAPSGPLKATVISRFALTEKNTKAAFYVPSLDRLLVLSAHKGIVVLRMDGTSETEFKLGGRQPEGMCLDDEGNLWIAEDRGKALLRFNGALQGLSDRLRRKASPR